MERQNLFQINKIKMSATNYVSIPAFYDGPVSLMALFVAGRVIAVPIVRDQDEVAFEQ